MGYHFIGTPHMIPTDHDMIALRNNIAERTSTRSRRVGTSATLTRAAWRAEASKGMPQQGTSTEKLQQWDNVFKGKMAGDKDSSALARRTGGTQKTNMRANSP